MSDGQRSRAGQRSTMRNGWERSRAGQRSIMQICLTRSRHHVYALFLGMRWFARRGHRSVVCHRPHYPSLCKRTQQATAQLLHSHGSSSPMWCRVVSRRVVSCRVVSCRVLSCRVASRRVVGRLTFHSLLLHAFLDITFFSRCDVWLHVCVSDGA